MSGEHVATAAAGAERQAPSPRAVAVPTLRLDNPVLSSRGILKRRSAEIMGYVGLNGQGKTLCMVRDTLLSLAMGRRVLSTVTILNPDTGELHEQFEPFHSWRQLEEFENGDILLDEVTGIMDSREQGMPKKVRKLLPQMRRRNVVIRWTGIDWDNSDRRLRQVTKAVTMLRGYRPVKDVRRFDGAVEAVPLWRPNRLFSAVTYDASKLTQSDDSQQLTQESTKKRRAKVLTREWFSGPGSVAFDSYNTLDAVLSIDNSCPTCGGKIVEKTCRGHD